MKKVKDFHMHDDENVNIPHVYIVRVNVWSKATIQAHTQESTDGIKMFNMVTFQGMSTSKMMWGNNGNGKLNRMNMHENLIQSCELCKCEVRFTLGCEWGFQIRSFGVFLLCELYWFRSGILGLWEFLKWVAWHLVVADKISNCQLMVSKNLNRRLETVF